MVSGMNISGIRPAAEIYEYKITKEIESQEIVAQEAESGQTPEKSTVLAEPGAQTETAFSYAKKYEPDKTYTMKGSESSLEDLDMEQGVSDKKKDQLLRQYQFFVGTSQRVTEPAENQIIYPYENFDI